MTVASVVDGGNRERNRATGSVFPRRSWGKLVGEGASSIEMSDDDFFTGARRLCWIVERRF